MKSTIRHTGIVVQDIDKSLIFWTKIMGFNILKKKDESGDYIDKFVVLCAENQKIKFSLINLGEGKEQFYPVKIAHMDI